MSAKANTKSPLDSYVVRHARMGQLLDALAEGHADHFYVHPDDVNWSHVCSITKACLDLEELCRFLGVPVRP